MSGHPALVGRRSDFRWKWFATRLHSFVVAFEVNDLGNPTAEELTAAAQQDAVKHKGGVPRGLQTGSATVVVFLTGAARPELRARFTREPKHRFAALLRPVLLEVESGTTTSYTGGMSIGRLYQSHLRSLVDDIVRPPAQPDAEATTAP